jgi:putative salt-induced outer membrane protein
MKNNRTKTNNHLLAATAATVALGCGVVYAADAPVVEKPPEKPKWEGSVNAGVSLTSGNSDSLLMTLGANAKKKWDRNEFALGAAAGYGEANDVSNNEFANAYAQYNRLFTDRFYGGVRADVTYDGIADLAYRVNLSPLAGYYFIKNDKTTLSLEVGPSLVLEKYFNQSSDTYCGIRFSEKFEHKLTETTKIWEYADYVPQVDRWSEKYVVTVEVGISAAINKKWGLRVVGQYIHDNEPAVGREPDDFRLLAGTEYKF